MDSEKKLAYQWQCKGKVEQFFILDSEMLSTPSATLYRAFETTSKNAVSVWVTKRPIIGNKEASESFVKRLKIIKSLDLQFCPITTFGVDEDGIAFVSLPLVDGAPLMENMQDSSEAERRFISCLKCVDTLHRSHIRCGDITHDSFYIDKQGTIHFVGVIGEIERVNEYLVEDFKNSNNPQIYYFSPEQINGRESDQRSDIYSMGVLGFRMLYGVYPYDISIGNHGRIDHKDYKEITASLQPAIQASKNAGEPDKFPSWCGEVIARCLQEIPEERYRNAGNLLSAISDIRQSNIQQLTNTNAKSTKNQNETFTFDPKKRHVDAGGTTSRKRIIILSAIAAACVLAIIIVIFAAGKSVKQQELSGDLTSPQAIVDNSSQQQEISFSEIKSTIEKLNSSSDPLVFENYKALFSKVKNDIDKQLVADGIIEKLKGTGQVYFSQSLADFFRKNLNINSDQEDTSNGETSLIRYRFLATLLDLSNSSFPIDERKKRVESLFTDPQLKIFRNFSVELIASLFLDAMAAGNIEKLQPLQAEIIKYLLPDSSTGRYLDASPVELLLESSEASEFFSEKLIPFTGKLSDSELQQLLNSLFKANNPKSEEILLLAKSRNLIEPSKDPLIRILKQGSEIPYDITVALQNMLSNKILEEDIITVGKWYDQRSPEALMSVLGTIKDSKLQLTAFDLLLARDLPDAAIRRLQKLIKKDFGDSREKFVDLIIFISNPANMQAGGVETAETAQQVDKILSQISEFKGNNELIAAMLELPSTALVSGIVRNYRKNLGLSELIPLLENKDPKLRIVAIKELAGYNDAIALKMIIDNFEKEKDPEVLKAYRDTFWSLKDR